MYFFIRPCCQLAEFSGTREILRYMSGKYVNKISSKSGDIYVSANQKAICSRCDKALFIEVNFVNFDGLQVRHVSR